MNKKISLAIPKGRILNELLTLFQKINLKIEEDFFSEDSRKLIFQTNFPNLEIIKVRSQDVATLVQFGAIDLGICGLDILQENEPNELFQLLNLEIGKCRLSLACKADHPLDLNKISKIRVATKYTNLTKKFFENKNIQVELIKLNGSIEVAQNLKICDAIVDLVSTGNSLRDNNMIEVEKILEISSHLIVNRTAFKTKNLEINNFLQIWNQ